MHLKHILESKDYGRRKSPIHIWFSCLITDENIETKILHTHTYIHTHTHTQSEVIIDFGEGSVCV